MKQYTVRLTDEQATQLDYILKECRLGSAQAAFELMVKNYLYYSQSSESLLKENDDLSMEIVRQGEAADSKIELLKDIILQATGRHHA